MKKFLAGVLKHAKTLGIKTQDESKIPKILLKGSQKTQIIQKIEEIVFTAKFQPVSSQMERLCEECHYAVMHDEPVRMDYLTKLLPGVNFKVYDEDAYNEWLRYRYHLDSEQREIHLDSTGKSQEREDQSFNESKKSFDKIIDSTQFRKENAQSFNGKNNK